MNQKLTVLLIVFNVISATAMAQGVAIGSTAFTPSPDALLELRSTSSGFLMPRMTEAQKDAIPAPSEGLLIWQTDAPVGIQYYTGGAWKSLGGDDLGSHEASRNLEMTDHWISNNGADNGIRIKNDGNVGIGVASPDNALDVVSTAANKNVIRVQSTVSNGWSSIDFMNNSGNLSATFGFANPGTAGIFTNRAYMNSYNNDFVLTRNSTENSIFISGGSGNIGINNNNPSARLDVLDGNLRLSRSGASAGELQLQGTGTGRTNIRAGAQGATNITYTLPTSAPSVNGAVLTSTTAGVMSWDAYLIPTTLSSSTTATVNPASYNAAHNPIPGMSQTNVPAGTYLITFNADISRNGSSACTCVVRAGGTDRMDTERNFVIPTAISEFTLQGKITLDATGTVEIRCRKTGGGSGFRVHNRTMTIQRTN